MIIKRLQFSVKILFYIMGSALLVQQINQYEDSPRASEMHLPRMTSPPVCDWLCRKDNSTEG